MHKDDTRLPATAIRKPALPPEARGSGTPAAISAAGNSSPMTMKKKPLLPPEARQRGGSGVRGRGGGGVGKGGDGDGGGGKGSNPMGVHGGAVKGGWCVSMKVTRLDKAARARAEALEREEQHVAMEQARRMHTDEPLVAKVLVVKPGKRKEGEACTLKLMRAYMHAHIHAQAHVCMSIRTCKQRSTYTCNRTRPNMPSRAHPLVGMVNVQL